MILTDNVSNIFPTETPPSDLIHHIHLGYVDSLLSQLNKFRINCFHPFVSNEGLWDQLFLRSFVRISEKLLVPIVQSIVTSKILILTDIDSIIHPWNMKMHQENQFKITFTFWKLQFSLTVFLVWGGGRHYSQDHKNSLNYGWSYMPELVPQITSYLPELFRQITPYLPEPLPKN